MQYYRCRCGQFEAWGSIGPARCSRCSECGSDLAVSPETHSEPEPHRMFAGKVQTDDGEATLSRCLFCNRTLRELDKAGEAVMEKKRQDIRRVVQQFGGRWPAIVCWEFYIPDDRGAHKPALSEALRAVGVDANCVGFNDDDYVYRPRALGYITEDATQSV